MRQERIRRYEDFANRLSLALGMCPDAPNQAHGRQKWLREKIQNKFSAETVSRWFLGIARPNLETVMELAQLLGVDPTWLSTGAAPDEASKNMHARDARAHGAINVLVGLIQLGGGAVAFSRHPFEGDIHVIIKGEKADIKIILPTSRAEDFQFNFHHAIGDVVIIAAFPGDEGPPDYVQIPPKVIGAATSRDYSINLNMRAQRRADGTMTYTVNGDTLEPIRSFSEPFWTPSSTIPHGLS